MKLLFATGNQYKYELMRQRLKEFKEIEVLMPKLINVSIEVDENGKTPTENAMLKARAYHKATGLATIAEDSGLWIQKFNDDEQPGLFVKRVGGREDLSDEEILQYYLNKLEQYGGESLARYKTGVAIVNETGEEFSTLIEEEPFILTTKRNASTELKGGVLNCISFDPLSKKYFNELTETEKALRYMPVDKETKNMVAEFFNIGEKARTEDR